MVYLYKALIVCLFLMLLTIPAISAHAAIQCYECHGTKSTMDYRPADAPYRDISTGGFQGNHQTHMAYPATPAACEACHPGSASYTPGHRDGLIKLSSNINASPLAASYKNSTSAFPQTSTPALGTCSNVNCHFESTSPAWGGAPFSYPAGCGSCHGSPPAGLTGGVPGSHATHDLYYTGAARCRQCHSDHAVEANRFAHATSAGKRELVVQLRDPAGIAGGSYSGPLNDYLPSRPNKLGNCTNLYCHSQGTGMTAFLPNVEPTWGTPLPADCSGCHGGDYQSLKKIDTGSHLTHSGNAYYALYVYDCSICHSATAAGSRDIGDRGNHVNQRIDVVPNATYGGSYSATGHQPGEPAGTCQNVYCHSNVQNPVNGVGGPTFFAAPQWGSSFGCGSCHQGDGGHGHSRVDKITTGSHTRHLDYSFTTTSNTPKCMICHKYTDQPFVPSCFGNPYGNSVCHWGTAKKHANHQVDVIFQPIFGNTTSYHGTPEPGDGYGNCTSTYCHSSGTSVATGTVPANETPAWGNAGPLPCTSCHGFPPAYANGTPKANSHGRHATYGYSCSACHVATTADGVSITSTVNHVNRAYNVDAGVGAVFSYTFNTAGGTCSGGYCHSDGTSVASGIITAPSPVRWGSGPLACSACHGFPPGYANGAPKANSHPQHGNYPCSTCHSATTADGTSISSTANHVNSAYNVVQGGAATFIYTFNATGGSCENISCHFGKSATWGTHLECQDCHPFLQ